MRFSLAILCSCTACDVSDPARFMPDASGGACAPLFLPEETVYADLSCAQPLCTVAVTQGGCELNIRINGCASYAVRGTLMPGGDPIFDPSDTAGTCSAATPPNQARLSFGCKSPLQSCRIDLYASRDRRDQFDLTPLVIDERPFRRQRPEAENALTHLAPLSGWLGGAVISGNRLIVARYGRFDDARCASTATASFAMIDLDTFTITSTVPAPPCPIDLVIDPRGDGFIAGYGGTSPRVGIFDAEGTPVKSATVALDREQYITDLEIAGNVLYVLVSSDEGSSVVRRFRLPELQSDLRSSPFEHRARAILPLRPGGLAVSDGKRMGIGLLDETLADYGVVQLLSERASSNNPGALSLNSDEELLIASATGSEGAIWVLDPRRSEAIRGQGVPYEQLSVPWAIAPLGATTMLAGLTARDDGDQREASLAIFDIDGAHFLPGRVPLGRGVVRALLKDGRGRFYAVLPWEARIVRIEAR